VVFRRENFLENKMATLKYKVLSSNDFYLDGKGKPVFGDSKGNIGSGKVGGNDYFEGADTYGDEDATNLIYGDSKTIKKGGIGGSDEIYGGDAGYDDVALVGGYIENEIYGDAQLISGTHKKYGASVGGNDEIYGGDSGEDTQVDNYLHGDADRIEFGAKGGNDLIYGGDATDDIADMENWIFGDADTINSATGGNDTIYAGDSNYNDEYFENHIYGDAEDMNNSTGGNDVIYGGYGVYNEVYGDAENLTSSTAGNDRIYGNDNSENDFYGDGEDAFQSVMGDDYIKGGEDSDNYLVGDSENMTSSVGGDDTIIGGGADSVNNILGDAYDLEGGQGGNDTITGGNDSYNDIRGDAYYMSMGTIGGDDTINGGVGEDIDNYLIGDAYTMEDSQGGNDTINLRAAELNGGWTNYAVGDAYWSDNSVGGDDILTGAIENSGSGYQDSLLVGDNLYSYNSLGGDDILISGTGEDYMYGDFYNETSSTGGADTFVFAQGLDEDWIYDFDASEGDIIDLSAFDWDFLIDYSNWESLWQMFQAITYDNNNGDVVIDLYAYDDWWDGGNWYADGIRDLGGSITIVNAGEDYDIESLFNTSIYFGDNLNSI